MARILVLWLAVCVMAGRGWAGEPPEIRRWADFVEQDFPFFGSVVDARKSGTGLPADNLTARGIVLNLGHELWAAFDLDLLRVAAIWEGGPVTPVSMSQGSYHAAGRKAPEGEDDLPRPMGRIWLATGIHAGIQAGETFSRIDPRDAGVDAREVGRGSLPRAHGRFRSIEVHPRGATLRYDVAGVPVEETLSAMAGPAGATVRRRFRMGQGNAPVWLAVGRQPVGEEGAVPVRVQVGGASTHNAGNPTLTASDDDGWWIRVPGGVGGVREWDVWIERGAGCREGMTGPPPDAGKPAVRRWSEDVVTVGTLGPSQEAYALDRVGLPGDNPWRRNVRMADLAFRPDGRAYGVTFDGDVWSIAGLAGELREVRWRRFASGLHEPLGVAIRDGEVFVHDRNGVWRLLDRDGNGEAEMHELFSDGGSQTAETREFASGLRVAPGRLDGDRQGRTAGCDPRATQRLRPADLAGRDRVTVLGHGFRQPFIGMDPTTGGISVSDQQGHYVPTTPLHFLEGDAYHGFLPLILPKNQHAEPIREPLVWIPHAINASAAGQVWLGGASMGPLSDGLIHLGYYRPEIFAILLDRHRPRRGAAVVSLTRDLDFAPLAGAVDPVDRQVYVTGFQIWGSMARETSGLARLRHTGRDSLLPTAVEPRAEGVLLQFAVELDRAWAANPGNYSLERWNYRRSADYGSAHYRPDGRKGQEPCVASSAYVALDGRSVFLGVPDMRETMQMRVGWGLRTRDGIAFARSAYLTPRHFPALDPEGSGLGRIRVDLTPREGIRAEEGRRDAQEGERVAELMGCVACHSTDGTTLGKVGPSWKGLWGSQRPLADGTTVEADAVYLRESIREPTARVVAGYTASDTGMPSYEGVLTEAQVDALIEYVKTLR